LISAGSYNTDGVRSILRKRLLDLKNSSNDTIIFGPEQATKVDEAFHNQHITHLLVKSSLPNLPVPYIIDELTGALGDFHFYSVPSGRAVRIGDTNRYDVTITRLQTYAIDIYEFNGFQLLGSWGKGSTLIYNSDFRKYRDSFRQGGDFLIISDIVQTTGEFMLTTPITL
jgi:hypothetical protein